ncbi:Pre-rRNA-processing rix1-like protein [Cladobotryum mycophilum]|uniref:Pre-rRNA-processing protein RIX1 n=1 Tax=Cladobotryum mycophilum TaxID=491253 RepID=A0ABR0SDU8_9HYPO
MATSLPPDLRVLCRKLTSIPPTQLPHSLPSLIRHVLRCQDALSAPQDQKLKGDASQTSVHVHKLRTSITTLLNGRSREGRFAAIGLVKAAVDVGGWETLRGAEPWVRGLLSIVQKVDPAASKELAIVTLTKIYLLVHPYQTLVREIATPTIPAFITACLQLIKAKVPGQPLAVPLTLVETICESFSTLIPLYSPTFRPFSTQIKSAARGYLAPTFSDECTVSESLQKASRRVVASLHCVAAKCNGSDEWNKLLDGALQEFHDTANQVFRAVDESWEATSGHGRSKVDAEGEPQGGDTSVDKLPPWSGLDAGTDRLVGLFHYLADILQSPTKAAVNIPISGLMDTVSRVCLIAKLSKSQTWEQSVETNPAIGREEKEELWSLIPDIHVAAMRLVLSLLQRLGTHMMPLIPEILDHLVRIFKSGIAIPTVRVTGYIVLNAILKLAGPTLSKASVDMLDPLIGACCRDLQQDAGFLKAPEKPAAATSKDSKKNGAAVNTDLFLQPRAATTTETVALETDHKVTATELLAAIFSHMPQSNLKPTLRGLLDKTAILTRNRDAMFSSVLNPYKDQRGRIYPSILPHLSRQFPHDQGLEILRSNLRTSGAPGGNEMFASVGEIAELEQVDEEDEDMSDQDKDEPITETTEEELKMGELPSAPQAKVDLPIQSNPFEPSASFRREASPPKRKHEGPDRTQPKRQELEKVSPPAEPTRVAELPTASVAADEDSDDDDDSDGSVHLNMELEDEDEDEDEEE